MRVSHLDFAFWDRRDVRQRVQVEWGAWLDGWPWEWFVTATFRDPVGVEQAHDRWRKWTHEIEDAVQASLGWVRCTEYQRWRKGIPHYHALVLGVGNTRRLAWMDRWNQLAGFARILPYDPRNGARFYLGKYVTKSDGHIEMSPNLATLREGLPQRTLPL